MLLSKLDECLPVKIRKISSDDQPFCTEKMKKLKRLKAREFHKNRRSKKWKKINKLYRKEVSIAKKNYNTNVLKDLKQSNISQWYSKLKYLCSYDQKKSEPIIVEEIKNLSAQDQAEKIADKFSKISQEYGPLQEKDIIIPDYDINSAPKFHPSNVENHFLKLKTNKSVPEGDIPPKLIKMFAKELSVPFCNMLNSIIILGQWPNLYKKEIITPVPKVFPPKNVSDLRNITGLLTFDKIAEKLISELMISDMEDSIDPAQYANQKGISLQHYLIKMINQILSDTDKNSKFEVNAVLATLIDWKEAFPRQCPKLGIEAFLECGVRPSLIPLLINYFQNRSMKVKWHGVKSSERKLNGSGPQGSTFGVWEYLAQSNKNANFVPLKNKYKFVDDLSILEKINLLTVGQQVLM